jgi:hypothetical protein
MNEFERNTEIWKKRFTARDFSDDITDLKEKIEYLSGLFKYIPIQQSIIDHFWILLTPDDNDIKKILFEEYYCYYHSPREHMLPVLTAPYIFMSCVYHPAGVEFHDQNRNIGIHAGVILSESLRLGLDVSTIACLDGLHKSKKRDKKKKQVQKLIVNHVGKQYIQRYLSKDLDQSLIFPSLLVCVGKAKPLTNYLYKKVDGFTVCTGQKQKKALSNLISKNE